MVRALGALLIAAAIQDADRKGKEQELPRSEPDRVVATDHSVALEGGRRLEYQAVAGTMTVTSDDDKPRAQMFYVAYLAKGGRNAAARPIVFSFNGGPGSSSVWLHLGILGPKRVDMNDDATLRKPPFELVENEQTLLARADLVFLDPVTTGYSRPARGVEAKEFHGVEEDIESVGRFIHLFVTRHNRWGSPRFLVGESYGTTRAAGLAAYLQERYGMELSGVMLVSSILDFHTVSGDGDLPHVLFLPTFTATAWVHRKLDAELQRDLRRALDQAEEFALNEYATALLKGNRISETDRRKVAEKLARFTGLSVEFVERANLRVSMSRFAKELRRDDRLTVGRLDSRYTGQDPDAAGERYGYDPSYAAIQGPYSECLYGYLRNELKFESDAVYEILTGKVQPWNYGKNVVRQTLDVSKRLRAAMARNPHLKVFVANGYYDLATPYFATEHTFHHLELEPPLRKNVSMAYYEAGHMMYVHGPSRRKLGEDLARFVDAALAR
jgi:carboxypeptidase C (cathepsin A)